MYKLQSLQINNIISFKSVFFNFRTGKAIIVVGSNKDDSSQLGNGSGKSALIESIALAFTGCSIRDVKTKELIYNGEDDGMVCLTLINAVDQSEFKIWRKLFGNSKSAEYKCWINGVDQCANYSDWNIFNEFIWKTIGISKEDFFSFYLITKENYSPFLIVGDIKKKEIINRFSGADKVDITFPLIEKDSTTLAAEIIQVERELLTNATKQEVLMGQLVEEEGKNSEEEKLKLIIEKELVLKGLIDDGGLQYAIYEAEQDVKKLTDAHSKFELTVEATLKPFKDAVELAELEVEAFEFSKDYEALIFDNGLKSQLDYDLLNIEKAKLPKVKEQFHIDINKIATDELLLREQLTTNEAELKEYEQFESDVSKKLQDLIECPKCFHKFSLRDKEFNVEEAQAALPGVLEDIKKYKETVATIKLSIAVDIQKRKEEINALIIQAGEGIKNEITRLNGLIINLGNELLVLEREQQKELQAKQLLVNDVTTCKNALKKEEGSIQHDRTVSQNMLRSVENTLQKAKDAYKYNLEQCEALQATIDKLKAQEVDRSKIDKLTNDISLLIIAEEDIKRRVELKRKEKESVDAWEINFKNFKSHLANKSIKNIQDYTNLFLNSMGSNLAISIDGYKTLASKKIKEQITTSVMRDGFDAGSYGKFSGGERGRIDISAILALQELIQCNARGAGLDLLIADEILDQVDTLGLESIINSLQSLGKTIMIVSQNEVNNLGESTLVIQKENKISTILN